MWNVQAKVMSVSVGETGSFSRSLRRHVDDIPDKQFNTDRARKANVLGNITIVAFHLFQMYLQDPTKYPNESQGIGLTLTHPQISCNMLCK
jgi:hypothetical protein